MSTLFTEKAPVVDTVDKSKAINEFAKIENLEPAIRQWLRETFQVVTLKDLANLSVNQVFFRLEDEGKGVPRSEVEGWVAQAQEFVAEVTPWQTFATFVVSLQSRRVGGQIDQRTIAYYLEADQRKIWSGIDYNGVCKLMLDQLGPDFQMSPLLQSEANETLESTTEEDSDTSTVDVSETTADRESDLGETNERVELVAEGEFAPESDSLPDMEEEDPVRLEITQLKVCQPLKAEETVPEGAEDEDAESAKNIVVDVTKRLLPGELPKEKPFDLEVTFQLSGDRAIELTKQAFPYHTEVYGQNRMTMQKLKLGQATVGTLVDGKLTYICRLPEVTLSEAGPYRLQVIAQLEGAPVSPDFLELPFVQVA
ncbi:MAG: hypothetical protein QNJ46_06540 [Leptolyngbyaceae cyanobacterium MO_188.B28]|nr:hypothetical protein [Leptolyngbyaceae cyanobacterium MO_188.B28]